MEYYMYYSMLTGINNNDNISIFIQYSEVYTNILPKIYHKNKNNKIYIFVYFCVNIVSFYTIV